MQDVDYPIKLTIEAYKKADRQKENKVGQFVAMFNPASYSRSYSVTWAQRRAANQHGSTAQYTGARESSVSLDLVLDGTFVDQIDVADGARQSKALSVKGRVQKFLELTLNFQDTIHQPNYLLVRWGALQLKCRLSEATVNYTAFDSTGMPLRAEIKAQFIDDVEASLRSKQTKPKSADLTHARTVRSGDTLPAMTKDVYGSEANYLAVAKYNGLSNFRNLEPGTELIFPPAAQLPGARAAGKR